jgi:hypothetical protein
MRVQLLGECVQAGIPANECICCIAYALGHERPNYPVPALIHTVEWVWPERTVFVASHIPHEDGEESWLCLSIREDGETIVMSGKG